MGKSDRTRLDQYKNSRISEYYTESGYKNRKIIDKDTSLNDKALKTTIDKSAIIKTQDGSASRTGLIRNDNYEKRTNSKKTIKIKQLVAKKDEEEKVEQLLKDNYELRRS